MPARKAGDESLSSLLLRTRLLTTSSSEDLEETAAAHKDALAAAQEEHRRVRESALRAYRNNELREAKEKLLEAQLQEVERLRLEAERAELAAQVLELQRKQIPIPAARAPSPPPPPPPQPQPQPPKNKLQQLGSVQQGPKSKDTSSTQQHAVIASPEERGPPPAEGSSQKPPTLPGPAAPSTLAEAIKGHPTAKVGLSTPAPSAPPSESPVARKYLDIHNRLKQLRAFVIEHANRDPELKKKLGEMRRQIRKSVGQLTEGKGANSIPVGKISIDQKWGLLTFSYR